MQKQGDSQNSNSMVHGDKELTANEKIQEISTE